MTSAQDPIARKRQEIISAATDTDIAPWTTVKSNDKRRARLSAMRYLLSRFDYTDKNHDVVGEPDPRIVQRGIDAVGD